MSERESIIVAQPRASTSTAAAVFQSPPGDTLSQDVTRDEKKDPRDLGDNFLPFFIFFFFSFLLTAERKESHSQNLKVNQISPESFPANTHTHTHIHPH